MADVDDILSQIRQRQAARLTGSEAAGTSAAVTFVLETKHVVDVVTLDAELRSVLPVDLELRPLFERTGTPAGSGDPDLSRFFRLSVPAVGFEDLVGSPFELAYHLKDQLDLASAEPDLETEFFFEDDMRGAPGMEAADLLGCWVDVPPPEDRAWALGAMRIPAAWDYSVQQGRPDRGADVLVAQPDTGVADHVELEGALDRTRWFDILDHDRDPTDPLDKGMLDNPGHGTATGSVAVSRGTVIAGPPGTGGPGRITGAAPKAWLVPIRCILSVVRIRQSTVAEAIEHARHQGCHIITMSLGGLPSAALKAAIHRAVDQNLIVLAAAGNCVTWVVWPARYARCLAVAGTNAADAPWKGSSRGTSVDVSAPGELVWRAKRQRRTDPTDGIDGGQGTSFSVALTAGVAALWLAHHGRAALVATLGPGERLHDRFRALLRQTARRPPGWKEREYGAGIVDAHALLQAGPGTPGAPGTEAMSPAEKGDAAVTADLLREALRDLDPATSGTESAAGLGLSPGELERYGLELTWLAFKARLARRQARSALEMATSTGTPPPRASTELREALANSGSEQLRVALAEVLRP
jgi:lambda repressor-like predicted transcriptional regulator